MLLTKIEAHNFGLYEDLAIDILPGFTAIVGPNGIGKSTLTEVVRFCLTGDVTGTKKDALRDGGPADGWGRIKFVLNGRGGEIYKELHSSTATMQYGDDEIDGVDSVMATLLAALEVEKQTIEDVVFAPQGELARVLFQRAADREKMFHRIFGLERMPRIERALGNELSKYGMMENLDEMRQEIKQELDSIHKEIQSLTEAYDRQVETVGNADINQLQQEYAAAQSSVALAQELATTKRQTEAMGQELAETLQAGSIKPDDIVKIEDACLQARNQIAELKADLSQTTRVLRVLSDDIAVCPVCNSPIKDPVALKATFEKAAAQAEEKLQQLEAEIGELDKDRAGLIKMKDELDGNIERRKGNYAALEARLKELIAKAPREIPNVADVRARLQHVLTATQELTRVKTRLETLKDTAASLGSRVKDLHEQLEKGRRIQAYLSVLEPTKKVFHYSKMPRAAAEYYLETLNALVNKYMGWFASEFTAIITDQYDIKCGTNVGTRKAIRLSGGQKTMLSIALRLALHEMFAHSFGFLWLDEPTVFLDEKNVEMFCDVLDTAGRAAQAEIGTQQLFVITHHKQVVPHADQVIDVEALRNQREGT